MTLLSPNPKPARTLFTPTRACGQRMAGCSQWTRLEPFSTFSPLAIQRVGIVFSLVWDGFRKGFVHAFVLFNLAPWSGPATSECDARWVFASSPGRNVVLSRVQFLRSASGTPSARTHVPPTFISLTWPLATTSCTAGSRRLSMSKPTRGSASNQGSFRFRAHEGGPATRCRRHRFQWRGLGLVGGQFNLKK